LIRIPPDVQIKASIKAGSVYYFAEEALKSREPHYFIVINRNPLNDTVLLLVCASSQIQKVNKRRRGCPPETLVQVSTSQYSGFTRTSVIDCNVVFERSTNQLVEKLKNANLRIKAEMSISLVEQLRDGVLKSHQVAQRTKITLRG